MGVIGPLGMDATPPPSAHFLGFDGPLSGAGYFKPFAFQGERGGG